MTDSALPIMRPMTLGELLDRAFRLYRQNFLKFIGIFAIPYIPLALIQTALSFFTTSSILGANTSDPGQLLSSAKWQAAMGGSFVFIFLQFIFVQGIATAALTRAVANNYTGKPVGILDSYRALSSSWLKLIFALVFVLILVMGLTIWTIIPCVGWFTGPGILFFIGLAVTPLIAPVIVLEKTDIFRSLRRAWDLARSRFWWLIGAVFVLTLLGQLIVTGPVYLLSFIIGLLQSSIPNVELQLAFTTISQMLVTMFVSLLFTPLKLTIMTVIYFDLRARSEGLDLALQISTSTDSENAVIGLPEITDKMPIPFIGWIDIGRFALLSLIGIAIYGIIIVATFGIIALFTSGLN